MRSLLVITNADAGTSDEERLAEALVVLREKASVEVAKTSNPGELDGVLHRAGGRTVVVAGGDGSLHAVVTALHKRRELDQTTLALLPMGTGNDFARGNDIPLEIEDAARLVLSGEPRKVDLIVDETGNVVVNNVHVGVGAQASRKGAKWKTRLGAVGVGKVNLGKLGYPIGAVLSAFHPPSWRLRVELDGEVVNDVDRPGADGGHRQRRQRRRRHRAQPRRRHRGRAARRDDQPRREAERQARLRPAAAQGRARPARRRRHPARYVGEGERRRVLAVGRRRDLRARAQPQLAPRAGGVRR